MGRAAELGYSALGLTDAADLGGVVRFVLEARRRGVRPIVGNELVVDGHPAAFLVTSDEGYRNLAALVTLARSGDLRCWDPDDRRRLKSRGHAGVSWHQVRERSAGLIALTGPVSSALASLIKAGKRDEAERMLGEWREVFGERLAVEVQWHRAGRRESALADALVELAEGGGTPWVVTRAPRYLDHGGRLVHEMLTALRAGRTLDQAAREGLLLPNGSWRLAPPEELEREFGRRPHGLETARRIASECDFDLKWMRPPLPKFGVPAGHDDASWLRTCAYTGARERWGEPDERQCRQLEHELGVIARLGFAGFFLVMWDVVRQARRLGILCQGRGSAANSAVAYCLGVTAVDPVANGLLFERFLSDGRVDGLTEAPDIDLDIEHDRREELLDYVYGKYDRASAAITCTVQHYRAPNALLDAMRALGYSPELAHRISKRLHGQEPAEAADRLVKEGIGARFGLRLDDARGRAVLAMMRALDGLPRQRSTHVGGFVLSSRPLGEHLPIEPTTMGRTIIQFDKDDLDSLGVPKFDFLGLGALSLVRRAFDYIEQRTGTRPELYRLPQDDVPSYELISKGDTIGTFQIESRAQIASILQTRPERLYDIVVQVSLIRPGPIQARFVKPYTDRRRGRETVEFLHPLLEPILARTQGIPIFQEQAMAIAMSLGRCTAAEADALRRTMGARRKRDRLFAELDLLKDRMMEQGITESVATRIRNDLEGFANYGFPESHAWSFALIAYATAYLKRHYPAEFYAGLLNSWPMGFYAPSTLIHDAKRFQVEVRPPCLRDGARECTVESRDEGAPALRIGWRHVRGMGDKTLDRLDAGRVDGRYRSIGDVVRRAALQKDEVLALARAGAFGVWESDRRRAAWEGLRVAGDDLPLAPAPPPSDDGFDPRPLTRDELIALDYHALGISLTGHPMERVRRRLRKARVRDSRDLLQLNGRERVVVAGMVTIRQRPETANGTIFLLLEDEHGFINVIVSARKVKEYHDIVKYAPFILVLGRFEKDGEVRNVVGERFEELKAGPEVQKSRDFR